MGDKELGKSKSLDEMGEANYCSEEEAQSQRFIPKAATLIPPKRKSVKTLMAQAVWTLKTSTVKLRI